MFRLFVLRDVLEEGGFVGKALVAGVALIRLVRLMTSRVGLEVTQLREGLGAGRMPALVGLVSRVRPHVLLQMRELRELALTDLAAVRFDAKVDP